MKTQNLPSPPELLKASYDYLWQRQRRVNKLRGANPIFAVSTQLMRVGRDDERHLLCPTRGGHSTTAQQELNVYPCDLLHKQFEEQERDSGVVTYPTRSNIKREKRALSGIPHMTSTQGGWGWGRKMLKNNRQTVHKF